MKQKKNWSNFIWLHIAIALTVITIIFYTISYSYGSAYSINKDALRFYATIDTWLAIFAAITCFVSIFKSRGWGRIVSVLLFILCSLLGVSAATAAALSQMTF